MSAIAIPLLSVEQYLATDRAAEFRSEYFEGQVFAMSGGTFAHFRLIRNFELSLNQSAKVHVGRVHRSCGSARLRANCTRIPMLWSSAGSLYLPTIRKTPY
jgi:hypothetical protein